MKLVRGLSVCLLVLSALVFVPAVAGAAGDVTLPEGSWNVTTTVTAKDAANQLEFGLYVPPTGTEEFGTYDPACGGVETDCAPGDAHTFNDLSGTLTFYLWDHTTNCETVTFYSTDEGSAHVTQTNSVYWTVAWDDGGALGGGDPPACARDGDFNDLVVDITSGSDIAVDKSDATPFGPDPVSSGGVVTYGVSVSNAGPNDASDVTVTDQRTGGTITAVDGGETWSCTFTAGGASCTLASLPTGQTAEPIVITVIAPSTTTDTEISDEVSAEADQPDPDVTDNSDSETTTVKGVQSGTTADSASGFYDGVNTLTLTTIFAKGDSMRSRLVVPPGYDPGQVTIAEKSKKDPLVALYCGNLQCDAQVLLGVFPTGDQPDDPIHLFLVYRDDARPGNEVWVHGGEYDMNTNPAFLAPSCTTPGVANPPKCVNSITSAGGQIGTKTVEILFAEGADPGGAKR